MAPQKHSKRSMRLKHFILSFEDEFFESLNRTNALIHSRPQLLRKKHGKSTDLFVYAKGEPCWLEQSTGVFIEQLFEHFTV